MPDQIVYEAYVVVPSALVREIPAPIVKPAVPALERVKLSPADKTALTPEAPALLNAKTGAAVGVRNVETAPCQTIVPLTFFMTTITSVSGTGFLLETPFTV